MTNLPLTDDAKMTQHLQSFVCNTLSSHRNDSGAVVIRPRLDTGRKHTSVEATPSKVSLNELQTRFGGAQTTVVSDCVTERVAPKCASATCE